MVNTPLRRVLIAAACIAAALVVGGWWLLGREATLVRALDEAVRRSGGALQVTGVSGSLLGPVLVGHVSMRIGDVAIVADDARLAWSPSRLLFGQLRFDRVEADSLAVDLPAVSNQPLRLPADLRPPVSLSVGLVQVRRLILGRAGEKYELNQLSGEFAADQAAWQLAQLWFHSPWGTLRARGQLAARPPFELDAAIDFGQEAPPRFSGRLRVSGNLARIVTDAEFPIRGDLFPGIGTGSGRVVITPFSASPLQAVNIVATGINPRAWHPHGPIANLAFGLEAQAAGDTAMRGKLVVHNRDPGTFEHEQVPLVKFAAAFDGFAGTWTLPVIQVELGAGGGLKGSGAVRDGSARIDLHSDDLNLRGLQGRLRTTRLTGAVNLDSDGTTHHARLALSEGRHRLAFDGSLAGNVVIVQQAFARSGASELGLHGSVALDTGHAFTLQGRLRAFDPAQFGDYPAAHLNGRFTATGEVAPVFKLTADLQVDRSRLFGLPANIRGRFRTRGLDRPEVMLDAVAQIGESRARAKGVLEDPANLRVADLDFTLEGRDLAQLYPILGVPLPPTPPYRLAGRLVHRESVWEFRKFTGHVGQSDLAGDFLLDRGRSPQFMRASLVSQRLDLHDLAGLIGGETAGGEPPRPGRVLPDDPFRVDKLRAADADIRFTGRSILTRKLPLSDMSAHLTLRDGRLVLEPLNFGVANGAIVSRISLDSRQRPIATTADVRVEQLKLDRLLPGFRLTQASVGEIDGRARLAASGNSVAAMLGSADGEATLLMNGGAISDLLLRLANLDLANSLVTLLRGDRNIPVRCMVADFTAQDGILRPRTLVLDTGHTRVTGDGTINLAAETLDLRLVAAPKDNSLLALRGPIRLGGTFAQPTARPDVARLAARGGAALALGTLATPFAAFLPLVDLGERKEEACTFLVARTRKVIDATP